MKTSARLLALVAGAISSFAARADVCVSSACGYEGTSLEEVSIPDAENSIFTDDGQLYVTGGQNVYWILVAPAPVRWLDESYAVPLFGGTANFTGLAQIGRVVYALTFDGMLYGINLDGYPAVTPIQQLSGVAAANGMVAGPRGELYFVNGPVSTTALPDPKIVRVKLDPANPYHVVEQTTWLAGDALMFPNGLTRKDNTLYVTDHNSAKIAIGAIEAVDIQADGSAGPLRQIAHFPSIPDDLTIDGTDFIVAEYSSGTVARISADGKFISQIRVETIPGASSVKIGAGGRYGPNDLIITQKGVIGVNDGDKLFVWHHN